MKTITSTIGLSLFFVILTFGQIEPRPSQSISSLRYAGQDDFTTYTISNYNYLPSGQVESMILDAYNMDGSFFGTSGVFNSYDENEEILLRATTRRYNSTVNIWITEYWFDYTYDNNGCETSVKFIQNVGGTIYKIEYEKNENCQPIREVFFWNQSFPVDTLIELRAYEYTYLQDGISYERKRYNFDDITGEWVLVNQENYMYNSNGNLEEYRLKSRLYRVDDWEGRKVINTYDQQGNIIVKQIYQNSFDIPEWYLIQEFTYVNEYDEHNRLINSTKEEYDLYLGALILDKSETTSEATDFACVDLVEKTTLTYPYSDDLEFQYEYFYEGKDECFEIENVMLEISIFPNPSMGEITIESPVLESGNTQVVVFDINGKLLLEKNEFRRAENVELYLGHLPNGMYVIQLMNQEHFVQQKVVIAK